VAQEKLLAEWFWIDRWVGSSAFGLPIDARGLYREMLTQAWRRGAQLPNDHEQIRRLTGVTLKEWRRTWPLVERFWRTDRDVLVNDTQLDIYAEAKGRAERASQRGLRGAQARAQALLKQRSGITQDQLDREPPITDHQVPPVVPLKGGRITREERRIAERIRENRNGCKHHPPCATAAACVDRIVFEIRSKAAAS
jgi:uncharacterized protein YdaU (DUF1376 family)